LSYGRECCSEIPCGIARSNDGQDYRLHPAPTKSVCRPPQRAPRHTSHSGRPGVPPGRARAARGLATSDAERQETQRNPPPSCNACKKAATDRFLLLGCEAFHERSRPCAVSTGA